ncbi:Tim44/TimA family putative adaptor protein [Magnetospirillum sp. 15-1]|uniref:Tim44/TimA family putative adaptor protein n=1 Tax=Magnetospirillum sp. 15-1 TaxID=1979370 RepID=UPI000BBC66A3|nr:Tim44/TimA family putative adaptor protein [Magnetospirillum sp. 15-1]
MNDGYHLLDIVFFAMVAAFLVLRLRSVLGKRTGAERPPEQWTPPETPADNVVDLQSVRRSAAEPPAETPVGQGLAAIRAADRGFDLDGFLGGAKAAFEMIVIAFAHGDKATLQPLLAPDVYRHFSDAIEARRQHGETLQTELVGIRSAELIEAQMDGRFAALTIRFVSEQVNALRDAKGEVVEGNPERVIDVIDLWTFRRDTRATDPNWALAATHTPEP